MEDREQWLKERQKGLGGTDMARVLGVSRYHADAEEGRDSLWGEKLGYVAPIEETGRMVRGRELESLIIEMYRQESGRLVKPGPGLKRHPTYDWMIANADAIQQESEGGKFGILEIKSFDNFAFEDFQLYGPHEGFIVQIQQYMAVHDLTWGTIVGHDCVNWALTWYDIKRDDWIIDLMYREGAKFWDYVKNKERPPSLTANVIIEGVKPKIATMYSNDWREAAVQYLEAKDIAMAAANILEEAKTSLIKAMGNENAAEGDGLRVYYKLEEGRSYFDKIGFQADNPDIDLDKYKKLKPAGYVFRAYDRRKKEGDKI